MMKTDDDSFLSDDRNIGYKDRLNYNFVLTGLVQNVVEHWSSMDLQHYVESLVAALDFDVEGLSFHNDMTRFKTDLDSRKAQILKEYYTVSSDRPNYVIYEKSKEVRFKMNTERWYWREYARFVIDKLAQTGALITPQGNVSIGREKLP